MRTITLTLFNFDELSAGAKRYAIAWYHDNHGPVPGWYDSTLDDAVAVAARLGISIATDRRAVERPAIYFSNIFHDDSERVVWRGDYRFSPNAPEDVREFAPTDTELHRIADGLHALPQADKWRAYVNSSPSGTVNVEFGDFQHEFDETQQEVRQLTQLLHDFARWIGAQLRNEYEHITSDRYAEEEIRESEFEFTSDGHPFIYST